MTHLVAKPQRPHQGGSGHQEGSEEVELPTDARGTSHCQGLRCGEGAFPQRIEGHVEEEERRRQPRAGAAWKQDSRSKTSWYSMNHISNDDGYVMLRYYESSFFEKTFYIYFNFIIMCLWVGLGDVYSLAKSCQACIFQQVPNF